MNYLLIKLDLHIIMENIEKDINALEDRILNFNNCNGELKENLILIDKYISQLDDEYYNQEIRDSYNNLIYLYKSIFVENIAMMKHRLDVLKKSYQYINEEHLQNQNFQNIQSINNYPCDKTTSEYNSINLEKEYNNTKRKFINNDTDNKFNEFNKKTKMF